jgi:hypothetical protein
VLEAVAADFVPLGGDIANQSRVMLRDPAQDEEGSMDLVGGQQIEQQLGA